MPMEDTDYTQGGVICMEISLSRQPREIKVQITPPRV